MINWADHSNSVAKSLAKNLKYVWARQKNKHQNKDVKIKNLSCNTAMFFTPHDSPENPVELVSYWQQQLASSPPLLELPTDKPRTSTLTLTTATQNISLAENLVMELDRISHEQDVEIFISLLAVFKILIYRYTGRQDILIGSPMISQNSGKIAGLDNSYINSIVLRTDLSGNPPYEQLLQRIKKVVVAAQTHQYLSFDRLVDTLNIDRNPSYHPLFQVMFSLEQGKQQLSPLAKSLDLVLNLKQTSIGISGYFEYSTDLFTAETIGRMVMHFQALLAGIVTNPKQPIDQLPLLSDAEQQQLLVNWNQTQTDYPNLCIHQLFEAQVERTPNNIAVVFTDQKITYRELNNRANQLANYLKKFGVDPDVPVGICLERSAAMMVGLLGILKAGGAYVPLDPSYPQDRLTYMLANSQVQVLISSDQFAAILPKSGIQVISLETDWSEIDQESSDNLGTEVHLDHLGYTIYTSGSTGLPKGVAMTQRALCNLIAWQIAQPMANEQAKTLQFTPISFDVSFQEIFSTWCVGGTLVLITDEIRRDPFALLNLLDREAIERLFLPFVALQQLAEVAVNTKLFPQQLIAVITAGEQLQITPAIRQFFSALANCTLSNHYGPSESHVVTSFTLTTPVENWPALPPIGRPIANTQIYVLDAQLQPVPIGIAGELYIGGDCLARGYFQRPELTAERFIPNPFDSTFQPLVRRLLYKTGDLVRYLHDGNIEYLGRIDNQVKIRGFRVELGEIETLLSQHPVISHNTIVVREDSPGNKQLVAYCVLNVAKQDSLEGNLAPQINELRSFIAQKVPSYMVPTFFVLLPSLPMTPSGKVDRRALPAPMNIRQLDQISVAAQDELELQLTKIWERLLGINSIRIGENFFELGGSSLNAVRLLTEIDRDLGCRLSLATLFQYPTIAELANIIRQENWSAPWSSVVLIKPGGPKPPLFYLHAIGGNILGTYPLANQLGSDQPIYGLQTPGLDGAQIPLSRVEDMAAHYIKEIQNVQPNGPYFLVGYSFGGFVAFEIACQLNRQGQKIGLLALLDTESPNLIETRPSLVTTVGIHSRNLRQLKMSDRLAYIKDRVLLRTIYKNKEKDFLIDNVTEILSPEYLQVLEANFQAGLDYKGEFYPGKITLFRSCIQPIAQALRTDLGWGELAGDIEIHDIPGDHNNLFKEPYIQVLGQKLKLCLDRSIQ